MRNTWSIDTIPSLENKTIIVTGGNSGIGFEAIRVFAHKGAKIILACRSQERGEKAMEQLHQEGIADTVDMMLLDLASLSSIKNFASQFLQKYKHLDVLLNNAGIMALSTYTTTEDSFEAQIGTNHLGHFALTGRLMDIILATKNARIVNVSSIAHKSATMDFDNFMFEGGKGYTPFKAYCRSKLCNLLFSLALQKKFTTKGSSCVAVSAHPGYSITNIQQHMPKNKIMDVLQGIVQIIRISQSQERGALPLLRASVDPQVKGEEYYGPDGFFELKGNAIKVKAKPFAKNEETAEQLWQLSEKLVSLRYLH